MFIFVPRLQMSTEEEINLIDQMITSVNVQPGGSITASTNSGRVFTISGEGIPTWQNLPSSTTHTVQLTPEQVQNYYNVRITPEQQNRSIVNEWSNWLNVNGTNLRDVTPKTEPAFNFFKKLKLIK